MEYNCNCYFNASNIYNNNGLQLRDFWDLLFLIHIKHNIIFKNADLHLNIPTQQLNCIAWTFNIMRDCTGTDTSWMKMIDGSPTKKTL